MSGQGYYATPLDERLAVAERELAMTRAALRQATASLHTLAGELARTMTERDDARRAVQEQAACR